MKENVLTTPSMETLTNITEAHPSAPEESYEVQELTPYGWKCLAASFLAYTLDAMDWMMLALLLPLIAQEFVLSPTSMGLLGTVTLAGTAISGLIAGILADRYGRVKLLGATMIAYSIMTGLCGLVESYIMLVILRFATGLGLGGTWAVGVALISDTWPIKRRARATSIMQTGWPLGYGLAALAFMYLAPIWGWRAMFFLGMTPALVACAIMIILPEPPNWVRSAQVRKAQPLAERKNPFGTIGILFKPEYRKRTILACIVASGGALSTWGLTTFLATYLYKDRGLTVTDTGSFIILFNIGAVLGYQIFGWISDTIGRRFSMALGLGSCALATVTFLSLNDPVLMKWSIPLFGLLAYGFFGTYGAYLGELFPFEARATGVGFTFNIGRAVSMFSPLITGVIATGYGMRYGIGMTAIFNIMGLIAVLFLPETRKKEDA